MIDCVSLYVTSFVCGQSSSSNISKLTLKLRLCFLFNLNCYKPTGAVWISLNFTDAISCFEGSWIWEFSKGDLDSMILGALGDRSRVWSDPIAFEVASDQTQLRSKSPLIRPNCARIHLWSDPSALEEVMIRPKCARRGYDQTQSRSKSPLIRPNCARSRVWLDPIAFEVASDQTQLRSNSPLIRPKCARRGYDQTQVRSKRLWSDPIALEVASDQTQVRSKRFMIRPNCARIRLWSDPSALESAYDQTFQTKMTSDQTISRPWSDRSALEIRKRPCNFGLGTHGCALDWVWSEVNLGLDLNLGYVMNGVNRYIIHDHIQCLHDSVPGMLYPCLNNKVYTLFTQLTYVGLIAVGIYY